VPEALTRARIYEAIRKQLADILEIDENQISETSSFVDDLNADSLALIELVEAIESEFSRGEHTFRIEDEDLEDLRTVRDAVDYVADVLGVAGEA
jgi:acyl carrier protein